MSKQLKLAVHNVKLGGKIYSGWSEANLSYNNTYHINENCGNTIIQGNQINGNNNKINEPTGNDQRKRKKSEHHGSPSTRRYKESNKSNASYSTHFENKSKLCTAVNEVVDLVDSDDELIKAQKTLQQHTSHHVLKKMQFTAEEKMHLVNVFNIAYSDGANGLSIFEAMKRVHEVNESKYGHLDYYNSIRRWADKIRSGEALEQKRGQKVNTDFRNLVESKVRLKIFTDAYNKISKNEVDEDSKYGKIVSIAYSYDIIKRAAIKAQSIWINDPKRSDEEIRESPNLQFSDNWICGFLNERCLHKRLITSSRKEAKIRDAETIRKIMRDIQSKIKEGKYCIRCIISADETGMNWDASMLHKYVSKEEIPTDTGDDKKRFTAMIWVRADGITGPPFIIIKCKSSSKYDYSNIQVVENLFKQLDDLHPNRYQYLWWKRTLKLHNTKTNSEESKTCCRPYILDRNTGAVITCQNKAWMDTIGLVMWADVQIGPYAEQCFKDGYGRTAIIWDNCGPHTSEFIKIIFAEHKIDIILLPKNMTWLLQVVDVVINAPLKSNQRQVRARLLSNYFEQYCQLISNLREDEEVPPWNPNAISLHEGIISLVETIVDNFNERQSFKEAVQKCFVNVGILPMSDGGYMVYNVALQKTIPFHEGFSKDPDDIADEGHNSNYLCNEVMNLITFIDHQDDEDFDEGDKFGELSLLRIEPEPAQVHEELIQENIMPPTAIEFLNKESVQKFKTVKQITPVMIARGFVVNPGSKLKDLKKMLIEYDKQKHDDAAETVAPTVVDMPLDAGIVAEAPAAVEHAAEVHCYCGKPSNNDMLLCSNEACQNKWYHFKCLFLDAKKAKKLPDNWLCSICS
jgi:hypothetical protein